MALPHDDSELEDVEDALVDGDVPYARGTAHAALRHRNFRIMYFGTFASNIGTWMQNVVLGAYALELTVNGAYVSLLYFGQLGPLLFLSLWGGLLADTVDRRRFLVGAQTAQGAAVVRAGGGGVHRRPVARRRSRCWCSRSASPTHWARPGSARSSPRSCPAKTSPARSRSTSVQMNLSRVIGPAIGGILYATLGAGWVFGINGLTYAFAVIGLLWAAYPRRADARIEEQGLARLLSGVRIARRDPLLDAPARHARDVLVLLGHVRRRHAADRRELARRRPQERAVRPVLRLFRGSAPRSAR